MRASGRPPQPGCEPRQTHHQCCSCVLRPARGTAFCYSCRRPELCSRADSTQLPTQQVASVALAHPAAAKIQGGQRSLGCASPHLQASLHRCALWSAPRSYRRGCPPLCIAASRLRTPTRLLQWRRPERAAVMQQPAGESGVSWPSTGISLTILITQVKF